MITFAPTNKYINTAKVEKMCLQNEQTLKKLSKMTLADYYHNLETPTPPKTAFIRRIAERCQVDAYTVRLWISGRCKPSRDEYLDVLSEETLIPKEELFANENN